MPRVRSETILGHALKDVRKNVVINTKFGHNERDEPDFSEAALVPSINGSLKRLQTNYLDSVILHNPDQTILRGKIKYFDILKNLKETGTIKGYGVSIDTYEELDLVLKHLKVDVIELLYNVFFQATRSLLDQVKAKNIALIIKVPLDSGWLTGKYHKGSTFTDIRKRWQPSDLKRRDDLIQKLKAITPDEAILPHAMGFLYTYEAITTVIPGIRNKAQLHDHINNTKKPFPKTLKKQYEEFYDEWIKDDPLPW